MSDIKTVTAFSRNDFREWLKKHHINEKKVKIILHKKHTGKSAPSHRELIEEAICFGWIDTTIKKLDENTYLRNFSKRNMNSKWSDNTLRYAKELLEKGEMFPEGLKFYKLGLKKPTHDHGIPKNPDMPEELKKGLFKNRKSRLNFDKFSNTTKRMFYRWILGAKLPETRAKRINKVIELANKNKKNIF